MTASGGISAGSASGNCSSCFPRYRSPVAAALAYPQAHDFGTASIEDSLAANIICHR